MGNKAERYTYRIEWSQEDGIFVARCVEFPGLGAQGHQSGRRESVDQPVDPIENYLKRPIGQI
jgi:hypothetical protein